MAVNQRTPRLDEVDQKIAVDVGDVGARCLLEVDWIAVHRFEGAHGGVHTADEV